jgi:hypothetical protein
MRKKFKVAFPVGLSKSELDGVTQGGSGLELPGLGVLPVVSVHVLPDLKRSTQRCDIGT